MNLPIQNFIDMKDSSFCTVTTRWRGVMTDRDFRVVLAGPVDYLFSE
jgi:hypothetical protein